MTALRLTFIIIVSLSVAGCATTGSHSNEWALQQMSTNAMNQAMEQAATQAAIQSALQPVYIPPPMPMP